MTGARALQPSTPARPRLGERLQHRAARRLVALPPALRRRLTGAGPVTLDGLFVNMVDLSGAARTALVEVADEVRAMLAAAGQGAEPERRDAAS